MKLAPPSPAAAPYGSGYSANTACSSRLANSCSTNTSAFAINSAFTARGMLDRRRGTMRAYDTGMPVLPDVDATAPEALADGVADALRAHGACRLTAFPHAGMTAALRADLLRL